jgi:hypothetical protein
MNPSMSPRAKPGKAAAMHESMREARREAVETQAVDRAAQQRTHELATAANARGQSQRL